MNVAANPDSMGRNCTSAARDWHVPKVIGCARTSWRVTIDKRCTVAIAWETAGTARRRFRE